MTKRFFILAPFLLLSLAPFTGAQEKKEEGLLVSDSLTVTDPIEKGRDRFQKLYKYKMNLGTTYQIDMTRGTMRDPYLILQDPDGKNLIEDDDGGGSLNSKIVYRAAKTGEYRIIATSLGARDTGTFTLRIWPLGGTAPAFMRMIGNQKDYEDVTVTYEPPATSVTGGGSSDDTHSYSEYRFTIRNKSATDSHQVSLTIPRYRSSGRFGHHLRSIKRSVDIGPKSTVAMSLFQPDLALINGSEAEVTIDGRPQKEVISVTTQNRGGRMGHSGYGMKVGGASVSLANILATPDFAPVLDANVFKSADEKGGFRPGAIGSRSMFYKGKQYNYSIIHRFLSSMDAVKNWSKNWLAYSSFDGVVLAADQLQAAPAEVQLALWQYVECGGSLLIVGPCKVPDSWQKRQAQLPGLTSYYPGFGQCIVAAEDVSLWEPEQWRPIAAMWDRAGQPWQFIRSPTDANSMFPVVENLSIPVRGLFVVMLVFTILIGPVNFYVLSKQRRRIWLLWTVPVFSFLTCLAVFGFMALSEGLHGHVRAEGLTILDEGAQRASSIGWLGIYTPMTPGDGLHFSYDAEVTPHLKNDGRYGYRSENSRTIDWTNDQHLDSGWVAARVPTHFMVRSTEKRLERILVRKEKGSLTMVNGLKAPISKFWLAATDGKIYSANDIANGKEATLKLSDLPPARGKLADLQGSVFSRDWARVVDSVSSIPGTYLRPGTYIAVVDGAPFLEEGLRGARAPKSRSIVYGIMKD